MENNIPPPPEGFIRLGAEEKPRQGDLHWQPESSRFAIVVDMGSGYKPTGVFFRNAYRHASLEDIRP